MHADEANDLGQPQDGANAHTVSDLIVHTWLRRVCLHREGQRTRNRRRTRMHAKARKASLFLSAVFAPGLQLLSLLLRVNTGALGGPPTHASTSHDKRRVNTQKGPLQDLFLIQYILSSSEILQIEVPWYGKHRGAK